MRTKTTLLYLLLIISLIPGQIIYGQDTIKLNPSSPGLKIPDDFIGLSFEPVTAFHSGFLTPSDVTLQQYFKTAGVRVLRTGGATTDSYKYYPGTTNKPRPLDTIINPEIDSLFGFLQMVDCKAIFGINLGYYNPSLASQEASYVMANHSNRLLAFEIGNEPNSYYSNGYRSPAYIYDSFKIEYNTYLDSIRHYYPAAPMSGAAAARTKALITAFTSYTLPFCRDFSGDISLLTQHYYAAQNKPIIRATIGQQIVNLLSKNVLDSALIMSDSLVNCANSDGINFRIEECNSMYPIGEWGVSNSFAASLWGLDYMYAVAKHNVVGVNFHNYFAAAGCLIDTASGGGDNFTAHALYYGVLAFEQGSKGRFIPDTLLGIAPNLNSYAVLDSINEIFVTVINKDTAHGLNLVLDADSTKYKTGEMISMTAPMVSDTFGFTLGGNAVSANGSWSPSSWTPVSYSKGYFTFAIPPATAYIIKLNYTPTGINELRSKSGKVSVFPNPNNGIFTITLSHPELVSGSQTIEVYNVLGQQVYSQFSTFYSPLSINLNNQPNGVYFYRVLDENWNVISNGKLIIQK